MNNKRQKDARERPPQPHSYSTQSWRKAESEGDKLWEQAFEADTPAESCQLWSRAGDIYRRAFNEIDFRTIDGVRLNRKIAASFRKGDNQIDEARQKLEEGLRVIAELGGDYKTLVEKAFNELEMAYCDFENRDYHLMRGKAEDIITFCPEEEKDDPTPRYILGNTYLLVGISLDIHRKEQSRFAQNALESWNKAERYLRYIDNDAAKRSYRQVKLNQARNLRVNGHCDESIRIYESLLQEKLSPRRIRLVRYNLIPAYLDRSSQRDIEKSVEIVRQHLTEAKESRNIEEEIWALRARLLISKEKYNISKNQDEQSTLFDNARSIYYQYMRVVKSSKNKQIDDLILEGHRLLAEIYIIAGDTKRAAEEITFIEDEKWPNTKEEAGHLHLTCARFYELVENYQAASFRLKEARKRFKDDEYRGMVVEVDVALAKLHMRQRNGGKARELLEKIKPLADSLACKSRSDRIDNLLVEQISKTSKLNFPATEAPSSLEKFQLQISQLPDNKFGVRAFNTPMGETDSPSQLPYTISELVTILKLLDRQHYNSNNFYPPQRETLRTLGLLHDTNDLIAGWMHIIGQKLYESLFPGDVGIAFKYVINQAIRKRQPIALQLRFDSDAVDFARYPWELLHDGQCGPYLLSSGLVELVRYITFSQTPTKLDIAPPWRLLYIGPRPKNLDKLPTEDEKQAVLTSLHSLTNSDKLKLDQLDPPTYEALSKIDLQRYHIIHFDGHGTFAQLCPNSKCKKMNYPHLETCGSCKRSLDDVKPMGYLAFEDTDGNCDYVRTEAMENILLKSNVRLAFLSACQTAVVRGQGIFGGLAPGFIRAGVPAVVAMQFPVPVDDAIKFAEGFYTTLSTEGNLSRVAISRAVARGRRRLFRQDTWFIPTLYLRSTDNN